MVRQLPPEVGRPKEIVTFYNKQQWQQAVPWEGLFNPLSEGLVPKLVGYVGAGLKAYTKLVDQIPYNFQYNVLIEANGLVYYLSGHSLRF